MIYNRRKKKPEFIKVLKTQEKVKVVSYGPYDNGHIILGMSNGSVIVLNSHDLDKMFHEQVFKHPIAQITFDPTQLLIIISKAGEMTGISLIKTKKRYMYLELGSKKFCTVTVDRDKEKKSRNNSFSKPAKPPLDNSGRKSAMA